MDEEAAIPVYDEMSNLLTFDIHEWPVSGKNSSSDFLSLPRDRLSASQLPVYSNADQLYLVQQQKKRRFQFILETSSRADLSINKIVPLSNTDSLILSIPSTYIFAKTNKYC
ncbi:hypothetical protein [Paenibacillus peoriae]|uniref:hypothetical protein n=1 Tax=Paenibacillus peoriae TaxID=59893 RepID=UPI0015C2F1E2|nr:hypothetical protein [Paenibacillus peoriae]